MVDFQPLDRPYCFGFICTEEQIVAAQKRPNETEQILIEDYREKYRGAFVLDPHGMHYIDLGGVETTPIWFPPTS